MDFTNYTLFIPVIGIIGILAAFTIYQAVKKQPDGSKEMQDIAASIHEGAMAFLFREYKVLAVFIIIVAVLMIFAPGLGIKTASAFIFGAVSSVLAGFFGMSAATKANVRTSEAARSSGLAKALSVSYNGGAVMGLSVASFGLFGVGLLFILLGSPENAQYINGFAMGASSIALFSRVGGGIYTKAADVGADLVGKVEAGIPEDDPRNPGVIADNVGDNVGDIAGMGADIFESYVGSIIATIAIAATAAAATVSTLAPSLSEEAGRSALMLTPLMFATLGLIASLIGVFSMKIL